MSVLLLTGKPGGGKSYESVAFQIYPALQQGRHVVTNLPLNIPEFVDRLGNDIKSLITIVEPNHRNNRKPFSIVDDFLDYCTEQYKVDIDGNLVAPLFVVDECHVPLYKRGVTRNIDLISIEEWFAEHRHYGVDVVLITQHYRKLNTNIADLCEQMVVLQKNTAFGSKGTYVRKVYDSVGKRSSVLDTKIRRYKPEYYPLYSSHTKSVNPVIEKGTSDKSLIWLSPQFYSIYFIAFLLILLIFFWDTGEEKPIANDQQSMVVESAVVAPSVSVVEQAPVPNNHPFIDYQMRFVGSYRIGSKSGFKISIYSKTGEYLSTLDSSKLSNLGYTITNYILPCFLTLEHGGSEMLISCASVSGGGAVAGGGAESEGTISSFF